MGSSVVDLYMFLSDPDPERSIRYLLLTNPSGSESYHNISVWPLIKNTCVVKQLPVLNDYVLQSVKSFLKNLFKSLTNSKDSGISGSVSTTLSWRRIIQLTWIPKHHKVLPYLFMVRICLWIAGWTGAAETSPAWWRREPSWRASSPGTVLYRNIRCYKIFGLTLICVPYR